MDNNLIPSSSEQADFSKERLLLIMLPFWSPLIPAQGIAALKSFLQDYGYYVKAVDATAENTFLELYNEYFDTLRELLPREQTGNFYNLGHDVLRDHMMVHANCNDPKTLDDAVKLLIARTFYFELEPEGIASLNNILEELFSRLEMFILDLLEEEQPTVLGLSAVSDNLACTRFAFELTRKKYPHIKTVMGGNIFFNHLSDGNPDLELFLEATKSSIDKVMIGKGEILMLKWLEGELPQSQRVFYHKDLDDAVVQSYRFDIPDLSDYDLQKYLYLAATASYSCPYNCSFCNSRTFFGKFRKRDPRLPADDINRLQDRHGHKLFFMTDALLNPIISNLSKELSRRNTMVYLDGYFAVDKHGEDIENALLWRRGGFYRARLGTESGSQRVLEMMGKKITPDQTKTVVANLAQAGIKTTTYWVIGHPGETEEDFQMTLDLLEELKNDIWQAECNPFRYYYFGQADSEKWGARRRLLFPEIPDELLMLRTWTLDVEPSREVMYERVFRFTEHCRKLGIPNPYSFDEIYKADERWKKLHPNAVPSIVELMNNDFDTSEKDKVERILVLQSDVQEEGDFCF